MWRVLATAVIKAENKETRAWKNVCDGMGRSVRRGDGMRRTKKTEIKTRRDGVNGERE